MLMLYGPERSPANDNTKSFSCSQNSPEKKPIVEAPANLDTAAEAPSYILATGPAARPRRTLKYDDSFMVLDSHGDVGASMGGPDGLFHADTRHLSRLELSLNEFQPLLLGSKS